MNKFVVLSLAYVALLAGCSLNNRFFAWGTKSESSCGFIFHDSIPHDKLYVPRNLEDFLDIYSRAKSQKSGEYEYKLVETLSQYYNKTSTTVPIESCNDKWCKIYYPCGDTEYYVKKDEIEQLWPNGQKTWGSK